MALNLVARTFRFAGVMIDKVRINEIRLKRRDGKLMWVKRRRPGSRVLALGANLFFRLAGNPISVAENAWSHGDPNFGNVIFDQSAQRARLIDFETAHAATSSPDDRHADDITVFLLDPLGSVDEENLPAMAAAFLAGYTRPDIWELAKSRLVIPTGFGRLWWGIRTEYAPIGSLGRRLALLRQCLEPALATTPFR
jgi:hypothetical protein